MKFLALLMSLFSSLAYADPTEAELNRAWDTATKIEDAFDAGHGRDMLGKALEAMFFTAARELRFRGHFTEANDLIRGWQVKKAQYFSQTLSPMDMGDHDPLSIWLEERYLLLEAVLGESLMKMLHLTDIYVVNFAVPVVFHPKASEKWCLETIANNHLDTCKMEYRRHFAGTAWQRTDDPYARPALHDGLVPVIAYWVAWGVCEAATYGTGYFIVCTPIGNVCEIIVERYVSPPLADKVYDKENSTP